MYCIYKTILSQVFIFIQFNKKHTDNKNHYSIHYSLLSISSSQ